MQPNFIVIHGHDIGRWLSCYGLPAIPTPNIERVASDSIVFEQAFAAAPLCTPARGALLTGRTPHANGLIGLAHDSWLYHDDVSTMPDLLGPLGYRTVLVGLQHENPDPLVLGYDEVRGVGFLPRAASVADEACDWLRARDDDRPFLLNVGMWEAHRPWPAEDYRPAPPETVHVPPYLPDNDDTRADIAAMYGALAQFDTAVGRVIDELDRTDYAADTYVILTTDHGVPFPRAKSTLYDAGIGVALVVRVPGGEADTGRRRVEEPVSHLDIVPTLLELAGGTPASELEGRSLAGVLRGDERSGPARPLFSEKNYHDGYDPMRAVRTESHKYIRNYMPGPLLPLAKDLEESRTRRGMGDAHLAPRPAEELYVLASDPDELDNRVDDPEQRPALGALRAELDDWMRRTDDPLLDGPIPPMPRPARPTRPRHTPTR